MQVSYSKLTVNDRKQMGGTTSHNRTLSHGSTRRKLCISAAGKNSLLYDPRISRSPNF